MTSDLPSTRLAETLWERHADPWSGWTRLFAFPVLIYAIFTRRRHLFVTALVAFAVNPVIVPREENPRAWTSELVQAERYWIEHGKNGTLLRVLDGANLPVTLYAVYAAYRRKPRAAAVATALSMALKVAFVSTLVRHYESEIRELQGGAEVPIEST